MLIGALLVMQSCVNLKPQESESTFYVLGTVDSPAPTTAREDTTGLTIGLRRLRLASYLDTPYIVIRRGPNEVNFLEQHRWGEDLRKAINRTVAEYLTIHSSVHQVDVVPLSPQVTYDYIVQINVLHFEGTILESPVESRVARQRGVLRSRSRLAATWQIIDPVKDEVVDQGRMDEMQGEWEENEYSEIVSGLDKALQGLAGYIADALVEL